MRYLISGYYGEGNAGDEAILAGILQELRQQDSQAGFTVLSFQPADTERRHRVDAIGTSLRQPGRLIEEMRRADLLISGGGSFLHEADFELYGRSFLWREGKLRPVPYFLSVILLAQTVKLPVMWYAQGLGPLHTESARTLVGKVGSRSQVVTWRDVDSARLAAEVGVRGPVQLVVPDPAYALEPAGRDQVIDELEGCGFPVKTPYIVVCPRSWLGRTGYRDQLAAAVSQVAHAADLAVLFLPFQQRTDGPLCRELAATPRLIDRSWSVDGIDDPAMLAGILGQAQLAITMRLHSGILSAAAGTPAVVIDYDPKVTAFAEQTGQLEWTVPVDDLAWPAGADRLVTAALDTLARLPRRRADLHRLVDPLKKEAGRTARLAVLLAGTGRVPGRRH